jgi:hypothetical protein
LEKRYERIRKACEARRAGKSPETAAKHGATQDTSVPIPQKKPAA